MSRQLKTERPTDADLKGNPLIGAGKGAGIAQATPDDIEDAMGVNTIEGDEGNGVNAHGGIDKPKRKGRPNRH